MFNNADKTSQDVLIQLLPDANSLKLRLQSLLLSCWLYLQDQNILYRQGLSHCQHCQNTPTVLKSKTYLLL